MKKFGKSSTTNHHNNNKKQHPEKKRQSRFHKFMFSPALQSTPIVSMKFSCLSVAKVCLH